MSMSTATQRSRILGKLGLRSADVGTTELDEHRNRIYSFEIPNECAGGAFKTILEFALTPSTSAYTLDAIGEAQNPKLIVSSVRSKMVLVNDWPIYYNSDPDHFWLLHEHGATNEQEPSEVLLDGRRLVFRPTPALADSVKLFVNAYRGAPPDPIEDEIEAMALVEGAAYYIAMDKGMNDVAAAMSALYFGDPATGKPGRLSKLKAKFIGNVSSEPMPVGRGF